jgi:uncharacterized protein (TIGR03083 family)
MDCTHIDALRSSVARLGRLAIMRSAEDLTRPAFPSEWSIADVLSHLGSGAVITKRRLDDFIAGRDTPADFARAVWDDWNAKGPEAQRDDGRIADAELLAALEGVTPAIRASFTSVIGPITLGFEQFVAMRLNEHAIHTWDIEVVEDSSSTIPQQAAAIVVDNLALTAHFTARPTGDTRTITVATTAPERGFKIVLTPDSVQLSPTPPHPRSADLALHAEAFARLVYGRLDSAHTPAGTEGDVVEIMRRVFPGP